MCLFYSIEWVSTSCILVAVGDAGDEARCGVIARGPIPTGVADIF